MIDAALRWLDCIRSEASCGLEAGDGGLALAALLGLAALLVIARRAARGFVTLRAAALTPQLSRLLSRFVGPVDYTFEEFLQGFMDRKYAPVLAGIAEKKEITDELREALTKAVTEAKTEFMMSRGIKAA